MTPIQQPIGAAVLYVASNVAPEAHATFTDWCNSIHHFDTMRIDGFLSLRRFELVEGSTEVGVPEFHLLTLYQVANASDADFSTPSYARHTATYVPPPDGVAGNITFERTVYERVTDDGAGTQPVGAACVSLIGADGDWLEAAEVMATGLAGVLGAHRAVNAEGAVLLVDVEDTTAGRVVLAALDGVEHGGSRRSLQLFEQVFPAAGVLVRDREVRA